MEGEDTALGRTAEPWLLVELGPPGYPGKKEKERFYQFYSYVSHTNPVSLAVEGTMPAMRRDKSDHRPVCLGCDDNVIGENETLFHDNGRTTSRTTTVPDNLNHT